MENRIGEKDRIIGNFHKYIFRDFQSGYTIFEIRANNAFIKCTGSIILPKNGVMVEVAGTWEETTYGKQLSNCDLKEVYTDRLTLFEFLIAIPGIGDVTANDLIDAVGEDFFEAALTPQGYARLRTVNGITETRADAIVKRIKDTKQLRELHRIVKQYGGNYNLAVRIHNRYGVQALEKLKENPYVTAGEQGMPFYMCDQIAKEEVNLYSYKAERVIAAVRQVMRQSATAGHTYLPYASLMGMTRKLLGVSAFEETIATSIINSCLNTHVKGFYQENDRVYLYEFYKHEVETAHSVKRLVEGGVRNDCDPEEMCRYAERVCRVKYADKQREAFSLLRHGGIGVITGGPGTGKTTVIKGLLAAYEKLYPENRIGLCAPTGRASQRMKEATGRPAVTIHRLIEYKPYGGSRVDESGFATYRNQNDPLQVDLLLVDEASMISIELINMLLGAVKTGTMVLLVGDIDQLPAVGAGNVLHDLIYSGVLPVIMLTKTHRQAEGSPIIENAKNIRMGIERLTTHEDFKVILANDEDIPRIACEQFENYHQSVNVFATQLLAPSRKRKNTGTNDLNCDLQSLVNGEKRNSIKYGNISFRVGDKIMMMRNNYEAGYYNGDVGVIKSIKDESFVVEIEDEEFEITESLFADVSLAYAATIHKSHGSEYNTVIIALPSEPSGMLQRNLLYTAVTRAKKNVVIVAAKGAIETSIRQQKSNKRFSALIERLQGMMPKLEGE